MYVFKRGAGHAAPLSSLSKAGLVCQDALSDTSLKRVPPFVRAMTNLALTVKERLIDIYIGLGMQPGSVRCLVEAVEG
jgi:hypothetical protein